MDRFAIYTYEPTEAPPTEGDLWKEEETSVLTTNHSIEKFEWLFGETGTEFKVQKTNRNGADKFPCCVMAHDSHVALLRLENVKNVPVYVKSQSSHGAIARIDKQNFKSNPYSLVIIDFNPSRRIIAIQVDSDSWRNTDTVCNLLEESINDALNNLQVGFNIKIKSKMQTHNFWDYSNMRIKKQKHKLSKITIYLDAGNIDPQVEAIIKSTPYLRNLMKELWGGKRAEMTIFDPDASKVIDRRKNAIENLVTIISSNVSNNKFGLKMSYDDGVAYTCGKDVQVEMPLDMQLLIELQLRSRNLLNEYNIEHWLDEVIEQTKEFKDVEAIKHKPGRKSKKQIS